MENTNPATMSGREAPCWIALRMSELMKAEQCSPNLSGDLASSAIGGVVWWFTPVPAKPAGT
jgi:hypothetical protein